MTAKKEKKPDTGAQPNNPGANWSLEMKAKVLAQEKALAEREEKIRQQEEQIALLEQSRKLSPPEPSENTPQPVQNVTPEIQAKMAELQGMINVLMHKTNSTVNTSEDRWKVSPTAVDVQEETVTFSARSAGYVVSSYVKRSVLFVAPFKPIHFQYSGSDIRKNGKAQDIVCYCTYSTNIIKEIEFLRNHPLYGIGFSENLNQTVSADAHLLYRMTAIITRLKSLTTDVMLNMAQREKINIHAGLGNEQIIMELASKMVKKELQMETERQESSFLRQVAALQKQE
jgi:hypothetical protein